MKYDLVFEGGGAKGLVFVGAMQEFERRGYKIGRLLGTSAGAINATLLTVGYDSAEMLEAMKEEVNGEPIFTTFMITPNEFDEETIKGSMLYDFFGRINIPWVPDRFEDKVDAEIVERLMKIEKFRNIFSFLEKGGWYSADQFLTWLRRKLDSGTYNGKPRQFSGMTLAELYEATGQDLSLIAADVSNGRMLVLNHRTAPQCPVVWATRMSMSIPLLWQEVIWQKEWGLYDGRDITGCSVVDGGVLSNFPIALFISDASPVQAIMGKRTGNRVVGMMIDEGMPLDDFDEEDAKHGNMMDAGRLGSLRTVQRIMQLINTMMQAGDMLYADHLEKMILRLPAKGYGTTEFAMTEKRRERLVANGRGRADAYFQRNRSMVLSASGDDLDDDQRTQVDDLASRMLGF